MRQTLQDCYVQWENGVLIAGNDRIERRWQWRAGNLHAQSVFDKTGSGELLLPAAPADAPAEAQALPALKVSNAPIIPCGPEALRIELRDETAGLVWRVDLLPGAPFLTQQVSRLQARGEAETGTTSATAATAQDAPHAPTGVEDDGACGKVATAADAQDVCEAWRINTDNHILHQIILQDQTDHNDNLLHWRTYRLGPVGRVEVAGCLFAVENPLTRRGFILCKLAPLPYARAAGCAVDLRAEPQALTLLGQGTGVEGEGYPWAVILFEDGADGITRALQRHRQLLRPYRPGRDGLAISNTWGDRNRDGALSEPFLLKEIAAARELGADACQIDDGWQKGVTSNSVNAAQGGVWEGYYAADPAFWSVNPERLPGGLSPLLSAAQHAGVGVGLWFSPDSSHDFANWRKDVDTILEFHRAYGVNLIKIDGVKSRTKVGEANLRRFFEAVLTESAGAVLFDLDVTAEVRPGYLGRPETGPLFVENRYTDWHRYWPHATLRNLWQLTRALPPLTLRMEWLNPARNTEKYARDPLAPAAYPVAYVFASIMVASPLLWCELSNLSAPVKAALADIIGIWKKWRQELHTGVVYPIGQEPDGAAWTGFLVDGGDHLHLISLRECAPQPSFQYILPAGIAPLSSAGIEHLAGEGALELREGGLAVSLPEQKRFGWWRIQR